jgi:hypothetical protein
VYNSVLTVVLTCPGMVSIPNVYNSVLTVVLTCPGMVSIAVAPVGAGAGRQPGAVSWRSLEPCTWSLSTYQSSPTMASTQRRYVLQYPQFCEWLGSHKSRNLVRIQLESFHRNFSKNLGTLGTFSAILRDCLRPNFRFYSVKYVKPLTLYAYQCMLYAIIHVCFSFCSHYYS